MKFLTQLLIIAAALPLPVRALTPDYTPSGTDCGVPEIGVEERKCFVPSEEDENYHLIENATDYVFFVNEHGWGDLYANVWKGNNPPVDLKKKELRVLDIGNSYTVDATHYLKEIMAGCGIIPPGTWSAPDDMALVCAIRGGASWKNWYEAFHDEDSQSYTIYKAFGGLDVYVPEPDGGSFAPGDGSGFRELLKENVFDLILIHPKSTYAPYYERWEEKSDAGYLSKLIGLLRIFQPQASIGFLLVHSLASDNPDNHEGSSMERWRKISESVRRVRERDGIDFVIPYGTAVENLRASHLNNSPGDLTQDGIHCASGIADYTAGCCYYQALLAPRYGRSVSGSTARIPVETLEAEMQTLEEGRTVYNPESMVAVDDVTADICHMAAILATEDWYVVRNPDDFIAHTEAADSEDRQEVIGRLDSETGQNPGNLWRGSRLRHYKDNVYVWINPSGKRETKILFNHSGGGEPNRTQPLEYVSRATYWPDGEMIMNPEVWRNVPMPYLGYDNTDGTLLYMTEAGTVDAEIEIVTADGRRLAVIPLAPSAGVIRAVESPGLTGIFIARLRVVDSDGNVGVATRKYVR